MRITTDLGDRNEVRILLNKWISNGWDINKKFIRIAGIGNSSWFTVFYDDELDGVCKDNESESTAI